MGFLGSLTGSDARRAARGAEKASAIGIREAQRTGQELIAPFLEASQGQLPDLREASSIAGLLGRRGDIAGGLGDIFGGVTDAREQAARQAAMSAGLDIGDATFQDIGQLPIDIAASLPADLERTLTGRSQELFAPGTSTALSSGALGQQAAAALGQATDFSDRLQQQAAQQGGTNISTLLGAGAAFLPQLAGAFNTGGTSALTPNLGGQSLVQSPFQMQAQGGMSLI